MRQSVVKLTLEENVTFPEIGHFSLKSYLTSIADKLLLIFLGYVLRPLYTHCFCSVWGGTLRLTEALCVQAANLGT